MNSIVHFARGAAASITAPVIVATSLVLILVDVLVIAIGYAACAAVGAYLSLRWTHHRKGAQV